MIFLLKGGDKKIRVLNFGLIWLATWPPIKLKIYLNFI